MTESQESQESQKTSRAVPRAIAIAIVVAALTAAGYIVMVRVPSDLAGNLKDGVADVGQKALDLANHSYDLARRVGADIDSIIHFRPRITTGGVTVVEATVPIAELSLVAKSFDHTYSWESTFLGSTKRIKLKGFFVAKAGYDLTQPFSIDVSDNGQTIRATMPPAKLNSIEQTRIEVLQDENGLWNKISMAEHQNALNALLASAKQSLDQTRLLAEADAALMARLEDAVRKNAPTAVIIREPSPSSK